MGSRKSEEASRMGIGQQTSASSLLGNCPLPKSQYEHILLGHGSGGKLTSDLIEKLFVPGFSDERLAALEDQATVSLGVRGGNGTRSPRVAFTTDSFVVRPIFFPGGDIGRLAVHGTVNDLAVGGALPLFLSAAFILEEGLPMADLRKIVASMRQACDEAGVSLVTGDTKVVDRGKGDGVYITTPGIGLVPDGRCLSIHNARPGDRIVVSGTIGDHGIAIMSVREGLEFETVLESDTAPLDRSHRSHAGGMSRNSLHARPDTWRAVEHPQRTGGGLTGGRDLDEAAIPVASRGQGGLRDARARPPLCRQRRKAGGRRTARRCRAARWRPCEPIRWAGTPQSSEKWWPIIRAWSPAIAGRRRTLVAMLLAGEQLPRIC